MERIKSQILLKRNLKALIRHRGKTQADLARHLMGHAGHADSWLSHILDENDLKRELPMELWDKTAAYLGVDTYHFFVPGVANNEATERRSGTDRRKWVERRLGMDLPARPSELDLMSAIRLLSPPEIDQAMNAVLKLVDHALRRRRARSASVVDQGHTDETAEAVRVHERDQRSKPKK